MGRILNNVICAAITSTIRGLTVEVRLGPAEGLSESCVANFDNILLLSRQRLVRRLGQAGHEVMARACVAATRALGCDES